MFAVTRDHSLNESFDGLSSRFISRRRVLEFLGGACAYSALIASFPGTSALAQVPTDSAVSPRSIEAPAIATKEQAWRWLSANGAHDQTYDWINLAWAWGGAVGIRPDLMLAQEMFETGWGHFGGLVTPEHHNVAGMKIAYPSEADLPEDFEWFDSWSEGIRAHANHLGAYCGATPVLGPNGEPIHDRYYVVMNQPWAGTVETTDGLSGKWSIRQDYAQVLHEGLLDPLRNI
jgi:N-acetylmuramoyl-L-alanine amidase